MKKSIDNYSRIKLLIKFNNRFYITKLNFFDLLLFFYFNSNNSLIILFDIL